MQRCSYKTETCSHCCCCCYESARVQDLAHLSVLHHCPVVHLGGARLGGGGHRAGLLRFRTPGRAPARFRGRCPRVITATAPRAHEVRALRIIHARLHHSTHTNSANSTQLMGLCFLVDCEAAHQTPEYFWMLLGWPVDTPTRHLGEPCSPDLGA
jgi:hypothetical protein